MTGHSIRAVTPDLRTGTWRLAEDESVLHLIVEGAVVCDVAPWTDNKTGELVFWSANAGDRNVALDERLIEVCRLAALDAGVAAPIAAELLREFCEEAPEATAAPAPHVHAPLLERFADLLAAVLDEPLTTLAGPGPDGGREPLQLRLSHFRPELAERAAVLLEEAGR